MNKNPTRLRLLPSAPLIAIVCLFLAAVSGCGPGDGDRGGKPAINEDTLRNHAIPISLAREFTHAFQATLDSNYRIRPKAIDSIKFSHAEEFPSDVFYSLLSQHNDKQGNAKGIRVYFGKDSSGQFKLVLVPVDSLGNDMIDHLVNMNGKPVPGTAHVEAATSDGQGYEVGQLCPPNCDNVSGLNKVKQ